MGEHGGNAEEAEGGGGEGLAQVKGVKELVFHNVDAMGRVGANVGKEDAAVDGSLVSAIDLDFRAGDDEREGEQEVGLAAKQRKKNEKGEDVEHADCAEDKTDAEVQEVIVSLPETKKLLGIHGV